MKCVVGGKEYSKYEMEMMGKVVMKMWNRIKEVIKTIAEGIVNLVNHLMFLVKTHTFEMKMFSTPGRLSSFSVLDVVKTKTITELTTVYK